MARGKKETSACNKFVKTAYFLKSGRHPSIPRLRLNGLVGEFCYRGTIFLVTGAEILLE
jgi:hypothetical protein